MSILVSLWGLVELHPFLACNRPVEAEVLVVEGWLPTEYLPSAVHEFHRGNYRHIITVGGPLPSGRRAGEPTTSAELAARALIQLGIDRSLVTAVSAPPVTRRKTWAYVQALRDWISRTAFPIHAINVFTVDVHARKSLLLFQRAFEPGIRVGVVAVKHQQYDPAYWWLSYTGIGLTTKNAIAYLDALLLPEEDGFQDC